MEMSQELGHKITGETVLAHYNIKVETCIGQVSQMRQE